MENTSLPEIAYSEAEMAEQKKQKSRNRIFGIVLGLVVVLVTILIVEIVCLITK